MSIFRSFGSKFVQITRNNIINCQKYRQICIGVTNFSEEQVEEVEIPAGKKTTRPEKDIDRTKIIPVETSIRYLKSEAYKTTYGDEPVWVPYRRNHKGQFPPKKTRKTCIRAGSISTGNPCPICRDEYLVLDHRNLELLQQFISPFNGQIISFAKTGLCQKKHQQLLVAIERARNYGLLSYDVPFREFDYSEYYGSDWKKQN